MLESVETTMSGMSEFVIFLKNYPPMFRQPYNTYLFIEKCMFGRQMEMEWVINFLLREEHPGDGHFGVLPIVGPRKVGKTTLVEHVCWRWKARPVLAGRSRRHALGARALSSLSSPAHPASLTPPAAAAFRPGRERKAILHSSLRSGLTPALRSTAALL
uniref:Uncharacterized protein n=1 Tax=Arundo donax TaxID=35708 RepID=A0A0A9DID9_ARUDO